MDPTLAAYLHASGDEAERHLATLLSGETDRAIRAIVSRTLFGSGHGGRTQSIEADDVRADVVVQVLERLRRLKSAAEQPAIENFPAYVASIAYRTCYTHLRRLYPERARLKNRLRYAVTYDPELTIEQDALGIWRCGLTSWLESAVDVNGVRQPAALMRDTEAVERFRREPGAFAREVLPDPAARQLGIGGAVKVLLERIGEPVDLNLLIDGIGGMLGVDNRALWMSTREDDGAADIVDPTTSVAQLLAFRQYLGRLWSEILELPCNQRVAILLNLRDEDGGAALPLLPMIGVATIRQIADVLGMPALDLAGIWRDLPLDDTRIAARLQLTRQQVINLRKSGRQRLGRRMARYGVV